MRAEPLLSVRNLKVSFHIPAGEIKALDGVSFEVGKGETLGIIGESGCGKTAACLSVLRLIPDPPGRIEGGELFFENRDILAMNDRELRSFRGGEAAMVFQEPMSALNPVFTVGRQIEEGILLHPGADRTPARKAALEWLDRAGFRDPERTAASYPFALSGGMRQRVMIAMALACRPKLLIADEPAASLDRLTRAHILRLIEEVKQETDLSCVFVTHDLETLRGIASRVLVMYAGRPCETAATEEILERPLHPYTRFLTGTAFPDGLAYAAGGGIPRRLPIIPDGVPSRSGGRPGCPFRPRCPLAEDACALSFPSRYEAAPDHEVWCRAAGAADKAAGRVFIVNRDIAARGANAGESGGIPLLELRSVKKVFGRGGGKITAVDGVSLGIRRETSMAVLGESGCGKTTLGRLAVRLLTPSSGGLFFDGKDITRIRGREERRFRQETQMVFQDPFSSLDPRMTVLDAIGEGLGNYRMAGNREDFRDRVVSAAEKCGLSADHCALYPHQFSGGQRQRIAIARALATNPKFIVCDEAVSSLDVPVRSRILNLLKDLQDERGLTYLFMTHDLTSALFMSREVSVMYRGRIVERGPSDLVFRRPRHPYTLALLEAGPLKTPVLSGGAAFSAPEKGCVYAPFCPRAGKECRKETPPDRETESGHFASCFRA
jgi:peptide/nickel transport system ATP-binding protein